MDHSMNRQRLASRQVISPMQLRAAWRPEVALAKTIEEQLLQLAKLGVDWSTLQIIAVPADRDGPSWLKGGLELRVEALEVTK